MSKFFATLAQARAAYPFARSLDQQVDFCAVQAAVNACASAGGGTVWLPVGTGLIDDTLIFPEARPFGNPGSQVNMRGDGCRNTKLKWTVDLGRGAFAVSCGDPSASRTNRLGRYAEDGMYEGLFEDFCLEGPNAPGSLGVAHTWMSGLAWGARRALRRIVVSQFYAGIDVVGDHTLWEDVQTPDNFYGLYIADPSAYLYGDNVYTKCFFNGCRMAAIAVHPRAVLPSGIYIGCYIGGAPYGVMKEGSGGLPDPDNRLIAGVVFDRCMFEYIGNAMLEDRNFRSSASEAISDLVDVQFRGMCYFQWLDGNRILGDVDHPRRAIWNVGGLNRVTIFGWGATFSFVPGEDCLFRVGRIENAEFDMRWTEIFTSCTSVGKPVFDAAALAPWSATRATWREGALIGGVFARTSPDGDGIFDKDDFVELSNGAAIRSSGALLPLGVAQMNSATPRSWIGVAIWASSARCRVAGPVGDAVYLKAGQGGAATPARGPQDGHRIGTILRRLEAGYAEVMLRV